MFLITAFEFAENVLALAAYISYLEMCSQKGKVKTAIVKGFTKRSAGPLWALIRECLSQLGKNARITAPYCTLFTTDIYKEVDSAITLFSQQKGHPFLPF
jgi:hypothetical protein